MTNAELIFKIKAEIERLKELHKTPTFKGDEYEEGGVNGYQLALDKLLSFLSTLELEKPIEGMDEGLTNEADRIFYSYGVHEGYYLEPIIDCVSLEQFRGIARHFYELGCRRTAEKYDEIEYNRQRAEEPEKPSEGLEDELVRYFGKLKDHTLGMHIAIHFAQWGAEHTPLPEDTVLFNKGVEEGKRLMMEEAVEGEYDQYPAAIYLPAPIPRMNQGDKVKIIIVKEDEK